jgi:dihydropteroate synthase
MDGMTQQTTLNARGTIISLERPIVMGILNLTPDSFYPGSRIDSVEAAVARAGEMLEEGAQILDVGAATSRPGSDVISADEELKRLMPVVEKLLTTFPDAILSIDTWRVQVAREVLSAGAHLINDITAGTGEPGILEVTAEAHAPFIAMHMKGTPGNLEKKPVYEDIVGEILRFFVDRLNVIRSAGITDIVLDPGLGFGKSVDQNFILLKGLGVFRFLELPLMIGLSRKSMVWRTLDISPDEALNGTTALHMIALQQGVRILRVHDVRAACEAIALHQRLSQA